MDLRAVIVGLALVFACGDRHQVTPIATPSVAIRPVLSPPPVAPKPAVIGADRDERRYTVEPAAAGPKPPAGHVFKVPYVWATARPWGAAVTIALDEVVDPYASSVALVMRVLPTGEHNVSCEDEFVVREVGRAALEALADDSTMDRALRFDLDSTDFDLSRPYALAGCVRDHKGHLHHGQHAGGPRLGVADHRWQSVIATPSGWIDRDDVSVGHHLLSGDPRTGQLGIARVAATRSRKFEAELTITMKEGPIVASPAKRRYAVADTRGLVRADALAPGDRVWSPEGQHTVAHVSAVSRFEFERLVFDVGGPDTYYVDGYLVADLDVGATAANTDSAPVFFGPAALVAEPRSYDCMVVATVTVNELIVDGLGLHITNNAGPPGALGAPTCSPSTQQHMISEAALRIALQDPTIAAHGLKLQESFRKGFDGCVSPVALTACNGRGEALGPARYGLSGATCLAVGTPVATPDGVVPIETLRPGDTVVGYDTERKRRVSVAVTRVASRTQPVGRVRLTDGHTLDATAAHPVYVVGAASYRTVAKLRVGDRVLTDDGPVAIASIGPFDRETTVVDISVDGPHNYFAGDILVHNY